LTWALPLNLLSQGDRIARCEFPFATPGR
jgi:hypothetical protein